MNKSYINYLNFSFLTICSIHWKYIGNILILGKIKLCKSIVSATDFVMQIVSIQVIIMHE